MQEYPYSTGWIWFDVAANERTHNAARQKKQKNQQQQQQVSGIYHTIHRTSEIVDFSHFYLVVHLWNNIFPFVEEAIYFE